MNASLTDRITRMRLVPVQAWPGQRQAALDGEVDGLVEVSVFHDDQRVLAAQLHLGARREGDRAVDLLAGAVEPVNEMARTAATR